MSGGAVPGGGASSGTVEVALTGELDLATLGDAERRVEAAEAAGPAVLVLDLSGLVFVDSSGVRLALLANDRARVAGRRFAVRLGTGYAQRVFDGLGLVEELDVLPPRADPGGSP